MQAFPAERVSCYPIPKSTRYSLLLRVLNRTVEEQRKTNLCYYGWGVDQTKMVALEGFMVPHDVNLEKSPIKIKIQDVAARG